MTLHIHQNLNCGQIVTKSYLCYSIKSSNTSGPRNWTHANRHKNCQAVSGECFQARAAVFPALTLLLSKEQRSLNATQVIAMQNDQGSQKTHQFNLPSQKGSNSEVNFLKKLLSLNSGVCIKLSRSYTVCSIFKVPHIISLIIGKLLLHPPLLHYLVPVLKSLKSRESNMNFVLRVYEST